MKKFASLLTITVMILILVTTLNVNAAGSPNYATNKHTPSSSYYYGYVQCQSSHLENGKHAARGYMRYWYVDYSGQRTGDTGRIYTAYGSGPDDSRIHSRNYTYIAPGRYQAQFGYAFEWIPAGAGYWPA